MKKVLLLFATLFALGQNAFAIYDFYATAPSGQTLYYRISGGNAIVTYPGSSSSSPYLSWNGSYYEKPVGNLIIPASVTFYGTTYVVIGIDTRAFYQCNGLTYASIPNSVTSIGSSAFNGCTSLTSITIGNSVTSIGNSTFRDCSSLISITIPAAVTSIGGWAFSGCTSLISINIPDSVTTIDEAVFNDCSGLTSINIPDGITSIGNYAFKNCSSLTSITIPDGVTSIGYQSFYYCSGLTSVNLGSGLTGISREAFCYCDSLASVTIPSSVTRVYMRAFALCGNLASVIIGEGVTSIDEEAFYYCTNLDTLYMMRSTPPSLGSGVFSYNASGRVFILSGCSYNNYYNSNAWNSYRNALRNPIIDINVNVLSSNSTYGVASVVLGPDNRIVRCDSTVVVQATPNTGYHFDHWSTGSTANPATITLMGDSTITAYFEANAPTQYTITATSANLTMGTVSGGGSYAAGATATLTASANTGYHFVRWNDNNTQNPRTITVTGNATYTAYFESNVPVNPATVTATISEITSTSAHAEIVKGQHTSYFYYFYGPQSVFTQNGLITDEAIISYVNQHYGSSDRNYSNVSGYMNRLTPSTEYLLVVVPYNNNDEVGTVCRTQFTTLSSAGTATMTATISEITATSAHAEIVKGQHTSYYYYFYGPQSAFTQNGLTTDEAIINYVNQNYDASERNYNNVSGYMNGLTPSTEYLLVVVPYNSNDEVGTITRKQFTTLNNNGIEDVGEEEYAISSQGGRLTVSGAGGELVSVYSIDGRCIYSSRATETTVIDVPTAGVYLVKVDDAPARKVVVIR